MKNKHFLMNRRKFLCGTGVALTLPWLETFANAKEINAKTPKRLVSIYHPNGVGLPRKNDPAFKDWSWFPHGGERDFKLTKVLDVLEPLRNEITIYSGLSHPFARNVHGHSNGDQYLTGAEIPGNGAYKNSISMDQVYSEFIGSETRHSSLVMSVNGGTGSPRGAQTMSFNREGRPIPSLNKPKHIFDTLFVTSGKDARAKLARSKSVLDMLISNTHSLKKKLSRHDQQTLQQYLDSVRDTEVKLEKAQKWIDTPMPKLDVDHLNLDVDHTKPRLYIQTMFELIYLALLSDSTRTVTFQMGRENGAGPHDLLANAVGLPLSHQLTHKVKAPNGWKNLGVYNRFQTEEYGRFIQKLKDTPEPNGNGNLLDNTFTKFGSASSSFHLSRNYPIISAGGKNLGFENGRYLKFGSGNEDNQAGAGIASDKAWRTESKVVELPLSHFYVTILQRLGVPINEFAGYKGPLERV